MNQFNIADWYWIVGGDAANVWSSARAASVPIADADYVTWSANHSATAIASMAELEQVFAEQYPPGSLNNYCVFKRWEKEQGGMMLGSGMPLKTDDRAQAKVNGAVLAATADPNFTTQWHAADGSYWPLDAAGVTAMSGELQAHINNCFTISSQTMAGIIDGSITTLAQIDSAFAATKAAPGKSKKQ
jgi:hypothetical protein